MAALATKCRGFTHPVILLIRSSLTPTAHESVCMASRSSCLRTSSSQRTIRLFSTGTRRAQQAKAKAKSKVGPAVRTPAKVATSSNLPAASSSYAHALAQRPGGATLYEGASQKVFIVSSYLAGFVCLGGGAANVVFNVYNVPPGVPAWTAYAFGSVGLMLGILGMNFVLKPANVVRSIRILPAATAASKSTSGYSSPSKIQIEVLSRKLSPIPGVPLRRQIVEPGEVVLKARMYNPSPLGGRPETTMSQEWTNRKKEKVDYDNKHRLTAPFRDIGWIVSQFFTSMRRGLTGEGFAPIEVKGETLKLDITNAYVLEDGRAMDRILKIEEDSDKAPLLFRKA